MKEQIFFSLIVPFYNEPEIIKNYQILSRFLKTHIKKYELIFVNDGSTDNRSKLLKIAAKDDPYFKLISYAPNRGRGYAVRKGFENASGDVFGYIDADLEISQKYLLDCLRLLKKYDSVVVSKHHPQSHIQSPQRRKIASYIFNLWVRIILGSNVHDHQAGLKVFKAGVIRKVLKKVKAEKWLFDIELLYFIQKDKHIVGEFPITITYGYGKVRKSFMVDFLYGFIYTIGVRLRK